MLAQHSSSPSALPTDPTLERASFLSTLLLVAGIVLFVDVELVAMAAAAVWSIAGLLHLPVAATATLAVIVGVPTLWACWYVARAAWRSEMRAEPEAL